MTKTNFPPNFEVKVGMQGVGAFTTKDIKRGETLFTMDGPLIATPTRTSVQVGEDAHIEDALAGHVNHSCSPNATVDRNTHSFVSVRDIKKGEEITFNYNENEDHLAEPFVCVCCGKNIQGRKRKVSA